MRSGGFMIKLNPVINKMLDYYFSIVQFHNEILSSYVK